MEVVKGPVPPQLHFEGPGALSFALRVEDIATTHTSIYFGDRRAHDDGAARSTTPT